jgi:SAM-dependent methyltransferase
LSYWSDLEKHGWDELWLNHPSVRARANLRVTGDPGKWPIQWLPDVVPDRLPFRRALSIGCGVGNLERSLVELSYVESVTGIDSSAEALERARRSAEAAGMSGRVAYALADARERLPAERGVDAIFFHSSLHHFDRLPDLLGRVRGALAPRGILFLDEYVGPARDEWTWRHLVRWNRVYWKLPTPVRRTRVIRRPINREDPTEAIESSGILPAAEEHFRVIARRDYGGNLLAPIYPSLLRPDQPGGPSRALFDDAVERLLLREERLLEREPGSSYHAVVVAEPR